MADDVRLLILTQSPMPEPLLNQVRAVSPRLRLEHLTAAKADEVGEGAWWEAEVLYTTYLLPEPEQAPQLRWVQGHYAGVDHWLDNPPAILRRVTLTTTSGIHATTMAEYVLMMLLAHGHRLPRMLRLQQAREWPADRWAAFVPRELRGATLGVVGYGSIGREIARLARCFGTRVLAAKRDPAARVDSGWRLPGTGDPHGEWPDQWYAMRDLPAMLGECDYVVLVAPLTAETRGLIDAAALQAMRPEAFLVNIGRGALVDEAALDAALRAGRLGGAALDVFHQEPLPADSPLWTAPNLLISPHVSGFTERYDELALGLFCDNLRRYLAGEPLLNVVDLERGY